MAIWYILWPFGISFGHLVHLMAIWYILWPFGISNGHLVCLLAIWYILWPYGNFVAIWHVFPRFGILNQEKSVNPDSQCKEQNKGPFTRCAARRRTTPRDRSWDQIHLNLVLLPNLHPCY
jgi:hypothetical protein